MRGATEDECSSTMPHVMSPAQDIIMQQRLVAALLRPLCYPDPTRHVRLIETHISWVLMAGRYAYKIKKSLELGVLDFSTLQARRHFCEEEFRLNCRLAPELYLGVVPIGGAPEHPRFGVEPAIEYAVKMRRFAATSQMDRLLLGGRVTTQHIDRLATTLARFHAALPASRSDSPFGSKSAIRTAAMQNFDELQSLLATSGEAGIVDKLRAATEAMLDACAEIFARRRAEGYVRECHGDLHLGNIALIHDEPVPFDCLEFNPALRWIDVMDEIAFPVMDLLYRGHPDLAYRLLNTYLENTGDYDGVAVLRFYLCYRATVRAKVDAIRADQVGHGKRTAKKLLGNSHRYLVLALACIAEPHPVLIITYGLPGSGKTTFAQSALERFSAIRIRSDVERKRLFGLGALEDSHARFENGIYNAEATQQTYEHLLDLSRQILTSGFSVIVDAAFLKREQRIRFHVLAQRLSVPFAIAVMPTDEKLLRNRILQRQMQGADASEADLAVLKLMQTFVEPFSPQEHACAVYFAGTDGSQAEWEALEALLGIND